MGSTAHRHQTGSGAGAPDGIQNLPGYALAQTTRLMRHAMDGALRELGLTTPQWGALACLAGSAGLCGADMARIYHLTPQTMHTILHNLELSGLIVRHRHPEHGALLLATLTPEGEDRLAQANDRVAEVQARMVAGLDTDEQTMLRDLLIRCAAALAEDTGCTDPLSAPADDLL